MSYIDLHWFSYVFGTVLVFTIFCNTLIHVLYSVCQECMRTKFFPFFRLGSCPFHEMLTRKIDFGFHCCVKKLRSVVFVFQIQRQRHCRGAGCSLQVRYKNIQVRLTKQFPIPWTRLPSYVKKITHWQKSSHHCLLCNWTLPKCTSLTPANPDIIVHYSSQQW